MNAKQFIDQFGRAEAERVAIAAGTNRVYFYQIANGFRNASTKLALRLHEESGHRLDVMSLMTATDARDRAADTNSAA